MFLEGVETMKWWLLTLLFAIALVCTSSKAGIVTAFLICGGLALYKSEERWWLGAILACASCAVIFALTELPMNDLFTAAHQRWDIWRGAAKIEKIESFWGIGMGMFGAYYNQLKLESYSSGNWAHNDILQISIEMGQWATLVFIAMFAWMYRTTRPGNLVAAAVLTAILMQSMVEFQFYVPVVSLLGGLALAWHSIKRTP